MIPSNNFPCVFDLSHLDHLYIHGKDAKDFLQGQFTCDINLLTEFKAQPTACCNLQGRIVALFLVMHWNDGYLLLLPKNILKSTLKHLKKYAVFSKITFEQNPNLAFIGFSGQPPVVPSHEQLIYTYFDNLFIIITSQEKLISDLAEYEKTHILLDANAWHYQQILHGFPDLYPETQAVFLPHRIGLQNIEGVLNFKKGCYLGQEIIARTHFKATLKHAVYLCEFPPNTGDIILKAGQTLFNKTGEESIGEIIDIAIAPDDKQQFLAAIKINAISDLSFNVITLL